MMEIRTDANGRKYEYHEESVKHKTELDRLHTEVASLQDRLDARIEQLHESESYGFRLRAEVASLKEEAGKVNDALGVLDLCMVVPAFQDLTQQLSAAKEYAERLREAGQAVVDRWHSPNWKDGTHTADYINRLRDAIRKSEG